MTTDEKPNLKPKPALRISTAGQQQRFASAWAMLHQAIAARIFPGAALAVTLGDELLAWQGFGHHTYDQGSPAVQPETVWDLASLTKPIATASAAMMLYQHGRLALEAKVTDLLPGFDWTGGDQGDVQQHSWRREVTVAMLLAHSSGLPAHRKLYLEAHGHRAMLKAALRVPLETAPIKRTEYSDIGYILLGEILERTAGEGLDQFCAREVFEPLKLNFTYCRHPQRLTDTPPTANDRTYRGRVVSGEVNDENASAMGGVAGHAGLFGDALSVSRFAHCLLTGGEPLFRPETVRQFTTRQPLPPGTGRTLGWDTPTPPSQSGSRFSPDSFGHLGYTGTSLWCDPQRKLSVTLLSNRTWPDSDNQAIKELRPRLHDAIVEALEAEALTAKTLEKL